MTITIIRRLTLIIPINAKSFVEKAHLLGADAIMLHLEDGVPFKEKESARNLIRDAIRRVARGGAEVLVRINKDPALIPLDVEASIHPGIDGIVLPKTEYAEEVRNLELQVEKLG